MKVLITGGAGFIGSHVAEHFIKQQQDVYIVDNLSSGYRANIPFIDDNHFFHTDIRNYDVMESIIRKHQFDVIIHLAAVVSVVDTVENPESSNDVNISALVHLLELSRKHLSHLKSLYLLHQQRFMAMSQIYLKILIVTFNLSHPMQFKSIVVNSM